MLRGLSDKEFEAVVKENRAKIAGEADRITRRTINVAARKSTESRQVVIPDGRYGCIVIDPPWPMEKIERDIAEIIGKEYPAFRGTGKSTIDEWLGRKSADAENRPPDSRQRRQLSLCVARHRWKIDNCPAFSGLFSLYNWLGCGGNTHDRPPYWEERA